VANSFKQMKDEVREFASGFSRPFALHYDASKQAIEILDTKSKLIRYANSVKGDMTRLISAFDKFTK
jgi:phenylalanine-4-hydroxylase